MSTFDDGIQGNIWLTLQWVKSPNPCQIFLTLFSLQFFRPGGTELIFGSSLSLWDFRPKLLTLCSEWSKNQRAHSTYFGGLAPYTWWHWLFARWLDSCPSVNLDQRPPWASQGPAWAVFKGRFRPWVDLIIQTHNPQIEKNFNWYPIKQIREMQIIEKGIEFETSEKPNSNRLPIFIKV